MIAQARFDRLSEFARSAVCAHVWADTYRETVDGIDAACLLVPDSSPPGDDHLRLTLAKFRELSADAAAFERENSDDIATRCDQTGRDMSQCGIDFALSRSGHGAGFFDTDSSVSDALQAAASVYGAVDLYLYSDGRIW